MMQLKGCPRCGGDLYLGWDLAVGRFVACLQCGRNWYPGGLQRIKPRRTRDRGPRLAMSQ